MLGRRLRTSRRSDPSGRLKFSGKAVLHAAGVDFSNGQSFAITMDQLQLYEDLGKGNYGTVKKVLHKPTNVAMAMKEIRLELDQAKLNAIIMELDILHRAVAPEIVEFYGAFFIESCVYYCMEYMDAGSMDKLQAYGRDSPCTTPQAPPEDPMDTTQMPDPTSIQLTLPNPIFSGKRTGGVPEQVLARVVGSMVRGLKFLKDELQIMHRDVKPTNVLVNRRGEIKLCDFGVSGQLEKSLAKTNIGCQSYMAPERIRSESLNTSPTYTVSSDVWSLGLSTIEMALGHYPYPPETYSNVFAQLTAIVHGDPPQLPAEFSETARDWVARCMMKRPEDRATYKELLEHPFLVEDSRRQVDMPEWVARALEAKERASREKERMEVLGEKALS
ncbi:MAP kinase [Neolentinus lepideus HHB14362 ss-1]|uniref:mitogen-activated protein kinase kinase n=1 Tax=Neolentinus lepideus HHB14362 ss-1 TaxID=1314782 RepID=A0A165TH51_9AGAM|nr:MAP kinase [Neolentinus lepideus HHB14362 ss-1]